MRKRLVPKAGSKGGSKASSVQQPAARQPESRVAAAALD